MNVALQSKAKCDFVLTVNPEALLPASAPPMLPGNIVEAVDALRRDALLTEKLGPHALDFFTFCVKDMIAYTRTLTPMQVSHYLALRL